MTPRPVVSDFAEELYAALAPLVVDDDANNWSALILCEAIGRMFQPVDDYGRDTDAGPGWTSILDPNRAGLDALPWLGQSVGVAAPERFAGEADADYAIRLRNLIQARTGFQRGTPGAMRAALDPYLTGSKQVVFVERDTSPYHMLVRTLLSETPDPAAAGRALLAQKPGGIILDYAAIAGQDYSTLAATHADYNAVNTAYATYDEVAADL